MRKLLEKMTQFAGQAVGQKPGEQWKGDDPNPPGKKLVGDSILKDLSKGPTPKTKEQELAEEWAAFNEDDLGVEPKRPGREGGRSARGHKEQPRYKTVKDEVDEATAAGLKVGDHVTANTSKGEYPGGHKSRAGKVTRVGQTGVHITPDDGGEVEYHPYKIVKKTVKDKDVYEDSLDDEYEGGESDNDYFDRQKPKKLSKRSQQRDNAAYARKIGSFSVDGKVVRSNVNGLNHEQVAKELRNKYPGKNIEWRMTSKPFNEGQQNSFYDGDRVELVPPYVAVPGEVYTVSQCDNERQRCWIGDADGFGWYATFDQLTPADEDDLDEGMEEFARSQAKQRAANKVYTITTTRESNYSGRSSSRSKSGTLSELLKYFGYTLEVGKSYEHERGRYKINMSPKNIQSLVDNLNKAQSNGAANGHSNTYYDVAETEVAEGKWFKTQYGWAGGRNEKTGGTYKHPDQVKADREAKKAAKADNAQQSKDAFDGMFGGSGADLTRNLKIKEEGWESGPDEYERPERDPDADYDAMRQEKADREEEERRAKRPQTKVYTLSGRGPNQEPNYEFPGEYASQEEAVAARTKLAANPNTPNPRDIGIRVHTKFLDEGCDSKFVQQGKKVPKGYEMTAHGRIVKKPRGPDQSNQGTSGKVYEGVESDDPTESAVLAAVQELIQQGHTEVAPEVITNMVVATTSQPFLLKDLVDANNNSLAIQHYIDSINPTKVKFSSDILTVKNEDPMKEKQAAQNGVAKMAAKAAGRSRLGESGDTPLRDKEDYDAKRKALQDLQLAPSTPKDPQLKAELARRLGSLNQQYSDLQSKLREFKESRGHKAIATKLDNMDRMKNVQIPTPAERREQIRIAKEKEQAMKGKSKVDEYGANQPSGTAAPNQQANQQANDPKQAQAVAQATQTLKTATGSSAPTTNIAKALDSASQGKPVGQQAMKDIEPLMKDVATIAQDPKLAGQFKNVLNQVQQTQLKQQQT